MNHQTHRMIALAELADHQAAAGDTFFASEVDADYYIRHRKAEYAPAPSYAPPAPPVVASAVSALVVADDAAPGVAPGAADPAGEPADHAALDAIPVTRRRPGRRSNAELAKAAAEAQQNGAA